MTRIGFRHTEETKIKIGLLSKGRITSEKTKKKISASLTGKKKSVEHIQKVRSALTGRKQSPEAYRKNIESHKGLPSNRKGVKLTQETKEKISLSKRGMKHSEISKQKIREYQINNPNRRFKNTSIELKIEEELKSRKIKYEKQTPILEIANVDFFLSDYKIVIQCDGCFYHNCPIHYPNHHLESRGREIKQDTIMRENGLTVYRFWEHEINKSAGDCINKIKIKSDAK